jgi:hypothetical protein
MHPLTGTFNGKLPVISKANRIKIIPTAVKLLDHRFVNKFLSKREIIIKMSHKIILSGKM